MILAIVCIIVYIADTVPYKSPYMNRYYILQFIHWTQCHCYYIGYARVS